MDWETLSCPHRHCRGYGKPFSQGYLVKNGTSRGQPRAWCTACEASVVLSYGTAYYGLEADPGIFETAVRALAEGNALRATARIVQVDKDTVCTCATGHDAGYSIWVTENGSNLLGRAG